MLGSPGFVPLLGPESSAPATPRGTGGNLRRQRRGSAALPWITHAALNNVDAFFRVYLSTSLSTSVCPPPYGAVRGLGGGSRRIFRPRLRLHSKSPNPARIRHAHVPTPPERRAPGSILSSSDVRGPPTRARDPPSVSGPSPVLGVAARAGPERDPAAHSPAHQPRPSPWPRPPQDHQRRPPAPRPAHQAPAVPPGHAPAARPDGDPTPVHLGPPFPL